MAKAPKDEVLQTTTDPNAKETGASATVEKIPMHTVITQRPTDQKDDYGRTIHKRIVPPIGQPFKFTQAEVDTITARSPAALRDPKQEGSPDFSESVDQAGAAAAAQARQTGGAPRDAENVARTGAAGNAQLPQSEATHTQDEDL